MKKLLTTTLLLVLCYLAVAQKVDSIRVEQAGDLVKVHYKILNSNQNQIFRVSVLCSINNGLKSVPNSLSGDFGDNIVGGRADYMVLWDVLKDVDELKSAEFFVKAELLRDLSVKAEDLSDTTRIWESKRIYLIPELDFPGSRPGLRLGYLGSFGISLHAFHGNIPVIDKYKSDPLYAKVKPAFGAGFDLTKRIISDKYFQLHIVAGYRNSDVAIYYSGQPSPAIWTIGAEGPEFGTIIAYRRLVFSLMYFYYNPEQPVNRNDDPVTLISPNQSVNAGLGIRF
jgi:hypothetical protein